MLIGTYRLEIDSAGYLTLPAGWRPSFSRGTDLIITHGVEKNLFVFPSQHFKAIAERVSYLCVESGDARNWGRFLIGSAIEQSLTKIGQLCIPESHRLFADLGKDAVLVGVLSRFEVWDARKYEEHEKQSSAEIAQIAERFDKLVRGSGDRHLA